VSYRRFVATLFFACLIGAASLSAESSERRIAVQGRASVEAVPDLATISVGVTSRAPQATAALDANSAAAGRIIDYAKRFGVAPGDIRTSAVTLAEAFKNRRTPDGTFLQEPDGYTAGNTVAIRLRDLARMGIFLREVLENGANRVSGVQFGLADPEKIGDEARKEAVEDARRKATLLAGSSGARLGRVVSISYPPRVEYRPMADGAADLPRRRGLMASVPIEAGVIEIAAEVDVTWELE
jgi:uncharacterized protein YggE